MRPDCTAGPGEDSLDTEPPLSGVGDRTERLLRWALVAVSPGELDLDSGRVNVTSDLLRFLPPASFVSMCPLYYEGLDSLLFEGGLKAPSIASPCGPKLCCLETGAGSMLMVGGAN